MGKLGLCQRPKPQHPHHVKVSPRGRLNGHFQDLPHEVVTILMQRVHVLLILFAEQLQSYSQKSTADAVDKCK